MSDGLRDCENGYYNKPVNQSIEELKAETIDAKLKELDDFLRLGWTPAKFYQEYSYVLSSNLSEAIDSAVLLERERIINLIRNTPTNDITPKYISVKDRIALKEFIVSLLTAPNAEGDTMLASEEVLRKDWDNPAEDKAWESLNAEQDVCVWTFRNGRYDSECQKAGYSLDDADSDLPEHYKFCHGCGKPIKVEGKDE